MTEHTISKEHMDALKVLADTNIQVSRAKELLISLQETETEYLVEREKKALERVQKILKESKEVIDQVAMNYREVNSLSSTVSSFSNFLLEAYRKLQILVETYKESQVEWEKSINKQEESLALIRQGIETDRVMIANDRSGIEKANIKLANDRRKLEDERGTLERAINRLKDNRI